MSKGLTKVSTVLVYCVLSSRIKEMQLSPVRIEIKNTQEVCDLFCVQVYNPLNNKRFHCEYSLALTSSENAVLPLSFEVSSFRKFCLEDYLLEQFFILAVYL